MTISRPPPPEIGGLLGKIISKLKVNERTRLATELHDSMVQSLTGASMKLRAADKMFESNPAASRRQLALALKTLDSCRDELRNCIWDLRNQALDEPVMDKVLQRVLAPHVGPARPTRSTGRKPCQLRCGSSLCRSDGSQSCQSQTAPDGTGAAPCRLPALRTAPFML